LLMDWRGVASADVCVAPILRRALYYTKRAGGKEWGMVRLVCDGLTL
jgi:hypothetical protein